jgi:hypothetical protein
MSEQDPYVPPANLGFGTFLQESVKGYRVFVSDGKGGFTDVTDTPINHDLVRYYEVGRLVETLPLEQP